MDETSLATELVPFNVIIPGEFNLSAQPKEYLDKIRDEIMDKETTWENRMANFFTGYTIAADSWRIRPEKERKRSAKTLFNSKSGETHRAAETLASVWQRMLTGASPFIEATKRGLNPDGSEVTEEQIFAAQGVLIQQLQALKFKRKLKRGLTSTSLFGLCFVEMPYTSLPYGSMRKNMEFTDFVPRPMIRSGFDTTVYDIYDSDYIFFIDFFSKWKLINMASQDTEFWDNAVVEKHIIDWAKGTPSGQSQSYSRLSSSRARAGYSDTDADIYETIQYHGRLEKNPILDFYAESMGLDADPKYMDWSVNVLDGMDVAKFHLTQYGDWRTRAKVLTYKDFEDEPLPYGVGQLGRKLQRTQDIMESLADDKAVFDALNMWKIGKYSGYDAKQFIAEPMKAIELEDVSQMVPLVGDPQTLGQILNLLALRREDFRNIVGAQTNLQAQITKASATESAIAQTEAIRSAGVHAEILAETIREYIEISHTNNLNYFDEPIWVGMTGQRKPMLVNKDRLPVNIGFIVKVVTDMDFRPEEIKNILAGLQMFTSIRNSLPPSLNPIPPLVKEYYRKLGLDPSLVSEPMLPADLLNYQMNQMVAKGQKIAPEMAGDEGPQAPGGMTLQDTPMGDIPTSNTIQPEVSA